MEQKARRRRVPAFGEWNYSYYGSAELITTPTAAAALPFERYMAAAPELEARSDVWFKYSPPPRKPPPVSSRKVRRVPAEKTDRSYGGGKRPRAATTPARAFDGVVPSSVPRTPAKSTRAARVVQRVDADLYQVPPPEFVHDDDMWPRRKQQRQRKKASRSRSLWMGCFGFSCRPAE